MRTEYLPIKGMFETAKLIKNNLFCMVYTALIDILFLFIYGITTLSFKEKALEYVIAMGIVVTENQAQIVSSSAQGVLSTLLSQQNFQRYMLSTVFLLIFALISCYLLWSLLQSVNWWNAYRFKKKKINFLDYYKKFFKVNFFWFLLIAVWWVLDFFAQLIHTSSKSVLSLTLVFASYALFASIVYFAFVSYMFIIEGMEAFASFRSSFRVGLVCGRSMIPSYFFLLLIFSVINLVLLLVDDLGFYAFLSAGIVLLFPFLFFSRIYISYVAEKSISKCEGGFKK